jgi:hypothetical protein
MDFEGVSAEATLLFDEIGREVFASISAWADSIIDRCDAAIPTLERQYPSLKGETLEYMDTTDLIDAVLLAHCNSVTGKSDEAKRLIDLLLASGLISDKAIEFNRELGLARVAAHAVAGDVPQALSELEKIGIESMPLAITAIALPVNELPVFAALFDEEPFKKYAMQERYQIARQARMLAAGETLQEIKANVSAAGYVLSN